MRNELERKGAEDSGAASGTDDHQATPQHVKDAIKLANSGTDDRRIPSNLDYDANDFDMGCSDMILWRLFSSDGSVRGEMSRAGSMRSRG